MTSTPASQSSTSPRTPTRGAPQLTAAGFERLHAKLDHAQQRVVDAREQVRQQMEAKEAESLGLVEAQHLLAQLEGQVEELETLLETAVLIDTAQRDPQRVMLGDVLLLTQQPNGPVRRVQLVSSDEVSSSSADPVQVSSSSPVGVAVLGARLGEQVAVRAGTRELQYVISSIETLGERGV